MGGRRDADRLSSKLEDCFRMVKAVSGLIANVTKRVRVKDLGWFVIGPFDSTTHGSRLSYSTSCMPANDFMIVFRTRVTAPRLYRSTRDLHRRSHLILVDVIG